MEKQIRLYLPVGVNQGVHSFGMHCVLLPGGGRSDQRLQVEFVRVEQQTDEGHLIVWLVADVADDDYARMPREVVDMKWRDLDLHAVATNRGANRGHKQQSARLPHGTEFIRRQSEHRVPPLR